MGETKQKILLIEDDSSLIDVCRFIFEHAGYSFRFSNDARQGVVVAQEFQPDLIILDVMMPAASGLSVYAQLRKIKSAECMPILIYSAAPRFLIEGKIPGLNPEDIIAKETSTTALLKLIRDRLPKGPPDVPDNPQ